MEECKRKAVKTKRVNRSQINFNMKNIEKNTSKNRKTLYSKLESELTIR